MIVEQVTEGNVLLPEHVRIPLKLELLAAQTAFELKRCQMEKEKYFQKGKKGKKERKTSTLQIKNKQN